MIWDSPGLAVLQAACPQPLDQWSSGRALDLQLVSVAPQQDRQVKCRGQDLLVGDSMGRAWLSRQLLATGPLGEHLRQQLCGMVSAASQGLVSLAQEVALQASATRETNGE